MDERANGCNNGWMNEMTKWWMNEKMIEQTDCWSINYYNKVKIILQEYIKLNMLNIQGMNSGFI